jgi:hypothetical protein
MVRDGHALAWQGRCTAFCGFVCDKEVEGGARMQRKFGIIALVVGVAVICALPVQAGVIIAPVAGVINSGGPGFGTLTETFNQAGLFTNYVAGVTDFDAYIALNPMHTDIFPGYEWFSNQGTTSASVTYDFGAVMPIRKLALWNEETSGIGRLDLYWSTDNVNYFALALGLLPTDNPVADYPADVFAFTPTSARYVRFDMSECPQPDPAGFPGCAIGEVAFDKASVPDAGSSLLLLGMGLAGLRAWKKRNG